MEARGAAFPFWCERLATKRPCPQIQSPQRPRQLRQRQVDLSNKRRCRRRSAASSRRLSELRRPPARVVARRRTTRPSPRKARRRRHGTPGRIRRIQSRLHAPRSTLAGVVRADVTSATRATAQQRTRHLATPREPAREQRLLRRMPSSCVAEPLLMCRLCPARRRS